jgi:hypothetical protein
MKLFSKSNSRFKFPKGNKPIITLASLHVVFMVLFDKVTAFAPDENGYLAIFKNLYKSDFSLQGYVGWQEGSINALRVVYLPAKVLNLVGFSDIFSIRLLTILYSMLTLFILLRLCSEIYILGRSARFWIVSAFFIPSYFLWTSIGLREGFIFLALVGIFYSMRAITSSITLASMLLILAFASLLLISKTYLYALLIFALLATLVTLRVFTKNVGSKSVRIVALCLIPVIFFPTISKNIVISGRSIVEVKLINPTPNPTPNPTASPTASPTPSPTASPTQEVAARGQTIHDLNIQIKNNPILKWVSEVTQIDSILESKSQSSYLPAGSEELTNNSKQLQTQAATLRDPISIVKGAFNFLFVPTPFMDNGSFFLNAQSYESFAWYLYYILLLLMIVGLLRGRYELNLQSLTASYFSLGFIIQSALVEINDGTSVRHRSVLLIGILIMLATIRQKKSKNHSTKVHNLE